MSGSSASSSEFALIIEGYVDSVNGCLVGTRDEKARVRSDLTQHLGEAAEAGELAGALERLGSPKEAAAAFAQASHVRPAEPGPRAAAVVIDNLPLVVVSILLFVHSMGGPGATLAAFPPYVYLRISDSVCVGVLSVSVGGGCGVYDGAGLLYALGVPLAVLWSVVALGVAESRLATTPGKALLGLKVVDEEGLRIDVRAGLVRRLSFLLGPLAWLDWLPFVMGRDQRLLDHVAGTKVVHVGGTAGA